MLRCEKVTIVMRVRQHAVFVRTSYCMFCTHQARRQQMTRIRNEIHNPLSTLVSQREVKLTG